MSRLGSAGFIVSPAGIGWAPGISSFIRMVSGAVPAYQASRLKPAGALRHE